MIDPWSAVCGAIIMVGVQALVGVGLYIWLHRNKKGVDEENIVDEVVGEYSRQRE